MFSSAIWRTRGPHLSNLQKIPGNRDAVYSARSAARTCFLADLLTGLGAFPASILLVLLALSAFTFAASLTPASPAAFAVAFVAASAASFASRKAFSRAVFSRWAIRPALYS